MYLHVISEYLIFARRIQLFLVSANTDIQLVVCYLFDWRSEGLYIRVLIVGKFLQFHD